MTNLENKKILVIGGSGFVGLHLIKRLSKTDNTMTVLCKNPDKIKNFEFTKKIKLIKGNITDYKTIEENIKNKDIIINLAAIVNPVSDFESYTDLDINCKGQLNVLEARKKVNPNSKYIFIGTRAQFGRMKKEDLPITEDYCQRPISLYGIHKQTAENYCKLYKRAFNLKSIILRLPQVYGPSLIKEKTHSIIDKFIRKSLKNEEFYVNGYGEDLKDLIYFGDVV
ncbi:MAG: NAD-dependent epimerase/dehydratase family protein, partial [Candidatus Thorarchaeota archaeon]